VKVLRSTVLLAALAAILALTNWTILQKRMVMTDGTPLLLALRPVDPLSLMQGYYMDLALAPETMPPAAIIAQLPYTGFAILTRDDKGVGRFVRIDDGTVLKAGEVAVRTAALLA